jgi:transcriptional regulator with XRE-family HTH domain
MDSDALVQLALDALSCSQKELADRLRVSPTQISKWKKGEHMSKEMADKLRSLTQIGRLNPQFALMAGSVDAANKWDKLFHLLADYAEDSAETGYNTTPLRDEECLLCWQTFHTLRQMGVEVPKIFPEELDVEFESKAHSDELWEAIEKNPYSSLIYSIYKSLNDVYGFYAAYVYDLVFDDELDVYEEAGADIDSCLLQLAAAKLDESPAIASNFANFQRQTIKSYEKWLNIVKEKAFRAGVPLRAELLNMVYDSHDEIGHEAEAEALGFNKIRLHPDIYMNELLTGMRAIHQVLPAILKKLGIEDEFQLDESELRLGRHSRH